VAEAKPQGEQFDGLPDFGLALSGSGDGPGLAVPARRPVQQAPVAQAPVVRRAARASAKTDVAECEEPLSKPRPKSVYKPSATEEARAAGVEGKVRVEVTVDESGNVVSARLLNGLGYGLDEASLAAARRAEFFPASRCGKPVSATLVISMRFSAG
jgi:protein TonB